MIWLTGCGQAHIRYTNYHYLNPIRLPDGTVVDNIAHVNIDSNKIIELTKLILEDTFPNIHSLLITKDNKLVYENYFSGEDDNRVAESLKTQIVREPLSATNGYSYLFWTQTDTVNNKPYNFIAAKGLGGQRIFINKRINLIVVITAGNYKKSGVINDGQAALDKYILPALR